jgi:hypothetical protein
MNSGGVGRGSIRSNLDVLYLSKEIIPKSTRTDIKIKVRSFDRICGLVVMVSGYRSRG